MARLTKWLVCLLLTVTSGYAQTKKVESSDFQRPCTRKDYQELLDLAFARVAGSGNPLLVVEVLPSFQQEYAFIFKRSDIGLYVTRARLANQLWSQLSFGTTSKTKQECLDETQGAVVDTATAITGEAAQRLWSEFKSIDLTIDSCPRSQDGQCALILDGTRYVIEVPNHASIRLDDIRGDSRIRSQNYALLKWVHTLLAL